MDRIRKQTIFFPDPSTAKKKALFVTFFVCVTEILSSPLEVIPLTIAWALIIFIVLYIAILIGIKMQLKKARNQFKSLENLVNDPNYVPIQVKVLKASYLSKIYALIHGRYQRMAIDQSGEIYATSFNDLLDQDFGAELYQIKSKFIFNNSNFVIPISK